MKLQCTCMFSGLGFHMLNILWVYCLNKKNILKNEMLKVKPKHNQMCIASLSEYDTIFHK